MKASELIKNFSRNYANQSQYVDEAPIKMKSRKVAFTSRFLHQTKKVDKEDFQDHHDELKITSIKIHQNQKVKLP